MRGRVRVSVKYRVDWNCLAPCMPPAGLAKLLARLHSWHSGSQTDLSLAPTPSKPVHENTSTQLIGESMNGELRAGVLRSQCVCVTTSLVGASIPSFLYIAEAATQDLLHCLMTSSNSTNRRFDLVVIVKDKSSYCGREIVVLCRSSGQRMWFLMSKDIVKFWPALSRKPIEQV